MVPSAIRAGLQELLDHDERGSFTHIVGARLERKSPNRKCAAGQVLSEMLLDPGGNQPLLPGIHRFRRAQKSEIKIVLARGMNHGLHVLGKARTAVTDARKEER